jgi:hypothetical protein
MKYFIELISIWFTLAKFHASVASDNSTKCTKIWKKINLPSSHMPYFFNSNEKLRVRCLNDQNCPFKEFADKEALKCWGYEPNCDMSRRLSLTACPGDSRGWVNS